MAAPDLAGMKQAARRAFAAGVARADPGPTLLAQLAASPLPRPDPGGQLYVIAVGKAAPAMANALAGLAGPLRGLCVTHRENDTPVPGFELYRAGHPVPDTVGAKAAARVQALLRGVGAADRVVALISGGGSALLPAPPDGVSLSDKARLNDLLLASGLEIGAMNMIRQQVSMLKGGGLAALAAPAPVTAYILSDVVGDDLRAIASGPTVAPIGSAEEARALLQAKGLWADLPPSIQAHLDRPAAPRANAAADNHLIGGNRQSVEAAAAALEDVAVEVTPAPLTGDVGAAAETLWAAAQKAGPGPRAILWGGETTVQLRGRGLGGRNQELALRLACLAEAQPLGRPWVFLSGGTDGRDGPTEAAGAITDPGSLARLRAAGGDPQALLAENDSNAALRLSGDLLITGATGTNVADLQILLLG